MVPACPLTTGSICFPFCDIRMLYKTFMKRTCVKKVLSVNSTTAMEALAIRLVQALIFITLLYGCRSHLYGDKRTDAQSNSELSGNCEADEGPCFVEKKKKKGLVRLDGVKVIILLSSLSRLLIQMDTKISFTSYFICPLRFVCFQSGLLSIITYNVLFTVIRNWTACIQAAGLATVLLIYLC